MPSPRTIFAIAFALAAILAPAAIATTRTTQPVGFMRYQVTSGLQTIGFPLVNAPLFSGVVTSVDGAALFARAEAGGTGIGRRLAGSSACYLEFTAGPEGDTAFVGDRLEVDVNATVDPKNPSACVRVSIHSANSTLPALPADLAGYHFVIRAHVTLASALGTGTSATLKAGINSATADQVHLLQGGSFQTYIFLADTASGTRHWAKFPEGTPADNLAIAPGTGLFLRRVAPATVTVRHLGTVRTHAFVQPLPAGYSLVSEAYPLNSTFASRGMTDVNGFRAGNSLPEADSVFLWMGSEYRTMFYGVTAGAAPAWRATGATSQSASNESGEPFSPFRAVLIQKLAADNNYIVPNPL